MSLNLIEAAKSLFSNELVSKASSYLNESESGVSKAISGILPSVFSGLVTKSATHEGANAIAQMAQEHSQSGILDNIGSAFSGGDSAASSNNASGIVGSLFGNKSDAINSLLSNFSGIKSSSVSSLLGMAAPLVLSFLGKHASANNLNAGGIASLLSSQKQNIASAMPAGLNLSSVFGNTGDAATAIKSVPNTANVSSGGGMKWLWPVLLLALLGAAAWYFFKDGCNKKEETAVVSDTTKATTTEEAPPATNIAAAGSVDSTGNFIYNLGKMITIDLPNGAGKLEVGENSTEAKLVRFLQDNNAMIDTTKGNWFDFTNVRFKTGSSDITEESMAQLKNMVAITKAFPTAQFKVGGYTDNTGDAAKNVTLSKNRAAVVAAKIKALGASLKSIISSDGYGAQFPIGDNSTVEGRAQNRRVSVNVKAK